MLTLSSCIVTLDCLNANPTNLSNLALRPITDLDHLDRFTHLCYLFVYHLFTYLLLSLAFVARVPMTYSYFRLSKC